MKRRKYDTILNELLARIRDGQFNEHKQLPTERGLAEQYGVSRMTARRALVHLAELGLVERRGVRGTLLRDGRAGEQSVTLSLIYSVIASNISDYLYPAVEAARRRNWSHRLVSLDAHDEAGFVRALQIGNPCIIVGEPVQVRRRSPLERALVRAHRRCAFVGTRMDVLGIPSVVSDDVKGMSLAVNRLLEAGHRKVALICDNTPLEHPVFAVEFSTWRRLMSATMSDGELRENVVRVDIHPYQPIAPDAYKVVRKFLAGPGSKGTTAMICIYEELADGAVAACRAAGRPVPEKTSLVQYADSPRTLVQFPPRDSVDSHLDRHMEHAIQMIEAGMTEKEGIPANCLRVIDPSFVVRKSVRDIAPPGRRGGRAASVPEE